MRISDWSSDVCSSDLVPVPEGSPARLADRLVDVRIEAAHPNSLTGSLAIAPQTAAQANSEVGRSEEHTSELQSLMRISYAVFCLKTKKHQQKANQQGAIREHTTTKKQTNLSTP